MTCCEPGCSLEGGGRETGGGRLLEGCGSKLREREALTGTKEELVLERTAKHRRGLHGGVVPSAWSAGWQTPKSALSRQGIARYSTLLLQPLISLAELRRAPVRSPRATGGAAQAGASLWLGKQRKTQKEPLTHLFHQDSFPLNAAFLNASSSWAASAPQASPKLNPCLALVIGRAQAAPAMANSTLLPSRCVSFGSQASGSSPRCQPQLGVSTPS